MLNRWIDRAWLEKGLLHANPRRPPFRLYPVPVSIVLAAGILDDLSSSSLLRVLAIAALVCLFLLHWHIVTRLMFISSLTEVSDHLAKGIEPPRGPVEALTDPD